MESPNPNSHEIPKSWSELPFDLLSSVFERLGFADFQRGKSVCSSWRSASKQFVPKNQFPWLIVFLQEYNSCTLLNPEEEERIYKTQDLGLGFAKSVCRATYGSWLLMRDPRFNLYIVNLFTQERINLPPLESQLGTLKIERTLNNGFRISNDHTPNYKRQYRGIAIHSPVFWIDEKTKDYVVVWGLGKYCLVYSKKGDTSWNQIPETSNCFNMVYKDHKLYFLSRYGSFKIFDFSGEFPQETFQCVVLEELSLGGRLQNLWGFSTIKLVVTVTGDVLVVKILYDRFWSKEWSIDIYKVCSSGFLKNCEKVDSLGDEAMFFDQGITVLANDTIGFKRNSIYFDGRHARDAEAERTSICLEGKLANTAVFLVDLETRNIQRLHNFNCSSIQFSRGRWFLPSLTIRV